MLLTPEKQREISVALGRDVHPAEHANVASFAQLKPADLDEMRVLDRKGGVLAIQYIMFRVKDVSLGDAKWFLGHVIVDGMPLEHYVKL